MTRAIVTPHRPAIKNHVGLSSARVVPAEDASSQEPPEAQKKCRSANSKAHDDAR
jgi:hypothetical protein